MFKNTIGNHQPYFMAKKKEFETAQKMEGKPSVANEEAQRQRLETHSLFEIPANNTPEILFAYDPTKLFKAGEAKNQDESAENVNSENHLRFHGIFLLDKLGYDSSKLVRAGSVKLK